MVKVRYIFRKDSYIESQKAYLQLLNKSQSKSKNQKAGPMALRILDIFAHHESLSAYQVFSELKSSFYEMAYKNVHKRIQRLQSLLLIEEIKKKTVRAKHGAKYYRLTEYGIYKLFLDRVGGVYSDTLPRKKLKKITPFITKDIFEYYGDNALFETFLYPYIDRKTLVAIHNILFLWEFFNYLQECCRIIEKILLKEDRGIPLYRQVCVWNKLLDKDNDKDRAHLLGSLIDIFDLEHRDLENISIEKVDDSNNALRISNPEFCILIELDREEKKAIAKLLDKNKIKYEYAIHEFDSDNILIESVHSEKEGLLDFELQATRRLAESLIYRIVCELGIEVSHQDDKFIEELRELSLDNKFMSFVDGSKEKFERGYMTLMKLRVSDHNIYHKPS